MAESPPPVTPIRPKPTEAAPSAKKPYEKPLMTKKGAIPGITEANPLTPETARKALEDIAAKAKPEATSPPEKKEIDSILEEAGKLLFTIGNRNVLLPALARYVDSTPLGIEFRQNVLVMLSTIRVDKIPPAHRDALRALQTRVQKSIPAGTEAKHDAFVHILEEQQKIIPKDAPLAATIASIIEDIKQEQTDPTTLVITLLQSKDEELDPIKNAIYKELKGKNPQLPLLRTPDEIVRALGIEPTTENQQKASQIFAGKEKAGAKGFIMPSVLLGLMVFLMAGQFIQEAEAPGRGGGGH